MFKIITGYTTDLYYVKDKNQREVDFLVTKDKKPTELIECKLNDQTISKNLVSFAQKLKVEHATQLVASVKKNQTKGALQVAHPLQYFSKID